MSILLDFNNISTWENIDFVTACLRISCSAENNNSYHSGALKVSATIFKRMNDKNLRAHFFLNCEKLDVRNWKLFYAYKHLCNENYADFVRNVLKSDEAMIRALKEKENLISSENIQAAKA